MADWSASALIDGTLYESHRADAPGEATLPCLYAMRWRHELEDDDPAGWPRRNAITAATVQLLLATAEDAATFGPHQVVLLRFDAGAGPVDWFAGRASFPTIETTELGVLATITVSSYLLDLAAIEFGTVDYPAESTANRLNRGMGAGWRHPTIYPMQLAARTADPVDMLTYLRDTLATSGIVFPVTDGPDRVELTELDARYDETTGILDPVAPWATPVLATIIETELPLQLREAPDLPGTYELYADPADPATAPWVIDGGCVELGARWGRATAQAANTIHVVKADDSVRTSTSAAPGEPVVSARIETELTTNADADALGQAYLPPDGWADVLPAASSWQAEQLTVLLDETADGWYPPRTIDIDMLNPSQPLRAYVAVSDVQRRHHPAGAVWIAGVVTALELDVAAGTARLGVQLEDHHSAYSTEFGDPFPIAFDDVPAAVTIDSVHPSVTFDAIGQARP